MGSQAHAVIRKVPEITIGFWIVKIAATTLGETGGDAVTMSMGLGYLVGTAIFASLFVLVVAAQIKAKNFHPFLFWFAVVATTTAGTTLADLLDRSLGIGYLGGTAVLLLMLSGTLFLWYRALGSISVSTVRSLRGELFYWVAIMFSQTLGTAMGDWVADGKTGLGLSYQGGALLFGAGLTLVAALYFWSRAPRTLLFWSAFILTRPLGATVGDLLDKPPADGGMALSRYAASAALAAFMLVCIALMSRRSERRAV